MIQNDFKFACHIDIGVKSDMYDFKSACHMDIEGKIKHTENSKMSLRNKISYRGNSKSKWYFGWFSQFSHFFKKVRVTLWCTWTGPCTFLGRSRNRNGPCHGSLSSANLKFHNHEAASTTSMVC